MKFILSENIKHILSERFILNEAPVNIDLLITDLDTKLTDFIKNNGESEDAANNLKTLSELNIQVSMLSNLIAKSKDPARIKGATKDVLDKIETLLATADATFNATHFKKKVKVSGGEEKSAQELFNTIKSLAVSSAVDKDTLNNIKENVIRFAAVAKQIANEARGTSKDTNGSIKYANDAKILLKRLQQYKAQVKDKFPADKLVDLKDILTEVIDNYGKYNTTKKPELLNIFTDSLKTLNALIQKTLTEAGFKDTTDSSDEVDWQKRFEKAADKNIFWKEYYTKAWGSNASKVAGLGNTFRAQCEKLGFSSTTNPFIGFIRKFIIEKNYPIGEAQYTLIHNEIASSRLNISQLSTNSNLTNLLFCRDLYTKGVAEIKEYFERYEAIAKELNIVQILAPGTADKITDDSQKAKFEGMVSHFEKTDTSRTQFIWNLMFQTISINSFLTVVGSPDRQMPSGDDSIEKAKLRPLPEIGALLRVLAPELADATGQAYDDEALRRLAAILPVSGGKTEVGKWISTMVTLFLLPKEIEAIYNTYSGLKSITLNGSESAAIKKKLFDLGSSMSKAQIENILIELEKKGKISFK